MFEQNLDFKLEDIVDGMFEAEWDKSPEKDAETEKRSSPEDVSHPSLKKHRIIDDNKEQEINVLDSSLRNDLAKTSNENINSSNTSVDLFSSVRMNSQGRKNIISRESSRVKVPLQKGMWQRKFPGPAGLVPTSEEFRQACLSNTAVGSNSKQPTGEELLLLMWVSSMMELPQWEQMLTDFDLDDESQPLGQFTIAWLKKRASARCLCDQKMPFLASIVYNVDCSSPDPSITLRDRTGEIQGTLDRDVWKQYGGQLVAGSVLVLRRASVLSLGLNRRRHYLNITSNNILSIYSGDNDEVRTTVVHDVSRTELVKSALDWLARKPAPQTPASPLSLFTSHVPFVSSPASTTYAPQYRQPCADLNSSPVSSSCNAFPISKSLVPSPKSVSTPTRTYPMPHASESASRSGFRNCAPEADRKSSETLPSTSGFKYKVSAFGKKVTSSPCGNLNLKSSSSSSDSAGALTSVSASPQSLSISARTSSVPHVNESASTSGVMKHVESRPSSEFRYKVPTFRNNLTSPSGNLNSTSATKLNSTDSLGTLSSISKSSASSPAFDSKLNHNSYQQNLGSHSASKGSFTSSYQQSKKVWGNSDLDVLEGLDTSLLFDDF